MIHTRRSILPVILSVILLFTTFGFASTGSAAQTIRIYLDGQLIQTDAAPYIVPKQNVTMVPLRVISEHLKASVGWKSSTSTATITQGSLKLSMKVGQNYALVNDNQVKLDANVQIKNGRAMVPLRFVSEQLGLDVKWYQATSTIKLTSKNGKNQLRGAWISTVYNLDWPSDKTYGNVEQQKQDYIAQLDDLQAMGLNAVFVQVRPAADALYRSKLVPWSIVLTGKQGTDPGYDPLAFMIEETHRRGMEFHAWFNPFRANTSASTDGLAANHVAIAHPDWIVSDGKTLYINPGIPEARQHIINTIMEVVRGYDIDGVHLDDYFYPSHVKFDDAAAFAAYNPSKIKDLGDWRRDNINQFVKKLGQSIQAAKPNVAYGISPFAVWRNIATDPTGSDTRAGVQTYDDMYADVRKWIRNEWIDYVMPQIYWSLSFSVARYDKLVDWWTNEVRGTNVRLYIGHAAYQLDAKASDVNWRSGEEIINQLKYNEKYAEIAGDVYFRSEHLRLNILGIADLLRAHYKAGRN